MRQHLVTCNDCRTRVDQLMTLQQNVKMHIPRMTSNAAINSANAPMGDQLEKFFNNALDDAQQQQFNTQLRADKDALKSALHYATHSAAMRRQLLLQSAKSSSEKSADKPSAIHRIVNVFKSALQSKTPLWAAMPAAIALSAVLTVIIVPLLKPPTPASIAVYQDDPVMHFKKDTLPQASIGFFGRANVNTQPYQNVQIQLLTNGKLQFSWSAVDNATEYTLSLYQHTNNKTALLTEKTVTSTQLEFSGLTLDNHQRYEWQLSGITDDQLHFSTRGGFVYNVPN